MINIDEYKRVCKLAKLVEASNSKTNLFKTFDQKECIELISGKLIVSKIIEMKDTTKEKVITDKPESKELISVLGAFEKDVRSITDEPKETDEKSIEKTENKSQEVFLENGIPIMPKSISNILYEKWQNNMSIPQRLLMVQNTSTEHILTRKGRGGTYKYVDIGYMIKCANLVFGFAWDSKVSGWDKTDTEIICFGSVEANINGIKIIKSACGQKDIAFKQGTKEVLCLGDDYKAAQSDMIKKALSQFGIAQDVYGGEV